MIFPIPDYLGRVRLMSRRPDMVKAMYALVPQGYRRGLSMREERGGACFGYIYFSTPPNLKGTPP